MNLYEINNEIMSCIDTETGEILDEEKLSALKMERKEKIRNIACFIKNLRADVVAYKTEKNIFAAREKAAKNKADRLAQYLKDMLGGEKIKEKEFSISYIKTRATEILDIEKIPAEYRIPQPDSIDKESMRKDLMAGKEVPGARLAENTSIQIK